MSIAVILPAAGSSSRFGAARNKLVHMLAGKPVIAHTLELFLSRPDVKQVILAAGDDSDVAREEHSSWQMLMQDPRVKRVPGGKTRAHSVLAALEAVDASIEWVAVHDAARPLVTHAVIDATLKLARQHGAAVPAMQVSLTIKKAAGPLPAKVQATVPRHELWAMQTPQIARRFALLDAFRYCPVPLELVTDDVQLIELAGGEVWLAPGDERNLKITTHQDLMLAEMLMEETE